MQSMGREIFSAIIVISLLVISLSMIVVVVIITIKSRQEKFTREKKNMHQEFEQQLLQSQIEVQEATFSALGKELHDNVGQLLSSTKMLLGITQRGLTTVPDTLTTAEETLGKAISELRSLSKSLTKEWLEQFNLIENLQAEVMRVNSANDVHIFLSTPQTLSLPSDKQIILFRIVQEALQNAIKHATAKNITINITEDNSALTADIKDDGTGFEETESLNGIGIMNMKHRTLLLNGTIQWQSKQGDGTAVHIILPINPPI